MRHMFEDHTWSTVQEMRDELDPTHKFTNDHIERWSPKQKGIMKEGTEHSKMSRRRSARKSSILWDDVDKVKRTSSRSVQEESSPKSVTFSESE